MKAKIQYLKNAILILLAVALCLGIGMESKAASSYTNTYIFYHTSRNNQAEIVGGTVYMGARGKTASSSYNLKYTSIGYDVRLEAGGHSVSFAVKRGGSLSKIEPEISAADGYTYTLQTIPRDTLYELAYKVDPATTKKIFKCSEIDVYFNAIITTKQGSSRHGSVEENGSGGLYESGTVYHVNNSSHLRKLKSIFTREDFEGFRNIKCPFGNYKLTVDYNLQGGTVGNGYSNQNDMLYRNGTKVETVAKVMQNLQFVNQDTIQLTKTGYHTEEGKEWTNPLRTKAFSDTEIYNPVSIYSGVARGDKDITVYANWKPNTYIIHYDANGGTGTMANQKCTYDVATALRTMAFSKKGCEFKEWNTKEDGTGTSFGREYENINTSPILNITAENNAVVTLYAIWDPNVYTITTDKQGGVGGTESG